MQDTNERLKELGLAWFALQCYDQHCPDCPSQAQCFKILAEMNNLRRKQRENYVHLHSTH